MNNFELKKKTNLQKNKEINLKKKSIDKNLQNTNMPRKKCTSVNGN